MLVFHSNKWFRFLPFHFNLETMHYVPLSSGRRWKRNTLYILYQGIVPTPFRSIQHHFGVKKTQPNISEWHKMMFFFLIFNVFRTNADFIDNFKDALLHMGFYLISDGKIPVKWTMKIQKEGSLCLCCWLCSNRIPVIHNPLLSFLFDW